MKLKTFLLHRQKQQTFGAPVIYFSADRYPLLFCAHFMQQLKKQTVNFKMVRSNQMDWQQLEATLSTTFLGTIQTLWLGDISSLNIQVKKKLLNFLESYIGPHTVLCFVSSKDIRTKSNTVVQLDDSLQKSDLEQIFSFFWGVNADRFLKMIGQHYKSISLDTLILLGQYNSVLGGKTEYFMQSWYEKIVLPEEWLFTLSQCFFARKRDLFFRAWNGLKDEYAGPFWTTFWSEQLWRAFHVIELRKANKLSEAKQMSYRLPFSFLQREWKTTTLAELQAAHQFLYHADCHLKTGGSVLALEVFYHKFMAKQF